MTERPKRKHELYIWISADDWQYVGAALNSLRFEFSRHTPGDKLNMLSAGPDYSYSLEGEYRPEQTPEKYMAELIKYLEEKPWEKNEQHANGNRV